MKRIILFIFLVCFGRAYSQDAAFTQSFMIPESINPSFSGFYQTTKAGLLYKNQQWSGFDFNLNSQFLTFEKNKTINSNQTFSGDNVSLSLGDNLTVGNGASLTIEDEAQFIIVPSTFFVQ